MPGSYQFNGSEWVDATLALMNFEERVATLDWTLFDAIETQTTLNDRKSLLALQQACVERHGQFAWLEIGSHLGGSLQVLIRDQRCVRIISIDSRPASQPDERGLAWPYPGNSTEAMRGRLGALPGAAIDKLTTIDASTETLDPNVVGAPPAVCFVDGEHTDAAVLRDARFGRTAVGSDGWLAFHDTGIVYRGLSRFLDELREAGVAHTAYFLPDTILVVELGAQRLIDTPQVLEQILGNAEGYLWTLRDNDKFRAALARPVPRFLLRRGLIKL